MLPNDAEAQSALGWVLAQQGEAGAALTHLANCDQSQARVGRAAARFWREYCLSKGKPPRAEQEARAAVQSRHRNAEAHRIVGADFEPACLGTRLCRRCGGRWNWLPERADLRDELGTILAQQNQFADAEVAFKDALRLQPNLEQAHFHLGVVYLQAQQLDQAASELGQGGRTGSARRCGSLLSSENSNAQSKNAEALQELRKAAALKPDWPELQIELGLACQHAGDSDGCAVTAFGEAVKLRPQDAEAVQRFGFGVPAERRRARLDSEISERPRNCARTTARFEETWP